MKIEHHHCSSRTVPAAAAESLFWRFFVLLVATLLCGPLPGLPNQLTRAKRNLNKRLRMFRCTGPNRKAALTILDKQKRRTSSAYNRWSLVWNLARYTNGSIYKTTLAFLDHRHEKVLDVGCGTGLMSKKLAATGRRVTGVDISAAMINRAQRTNDLRIEFTLGDAERLPFPDRSFDAVVNLISFHHYPEPLRAAAEFR